MRYSHCQAWTPQRRSRRGSSAACRRSFNRYRSFYLVSRIAPAQTPIAELDGQGHIRARYRRRSKPITRPSRRFGEIDLICG